MGGRVKIARGPYAPTSDAVWLAAAAGEITRARTVLDVGIGTGAVSLCLATHLPDVQITGIDTAEQMLATAQQNAQMNGRDMELINADIMTWRTARTFDLVVTNPPYFRGTPAQHNAHHNADLGQWMRKCVARVRPRGHICTIVDAGALAQVITAIGPKCGDIIIYPLIGASSRTERVIIRARVGSHGPTQLKLPISMGDGAILRDGLTIGRALATLG